MGDTTFYVAGKQVKLTKALKAGLIYVSIDVALSSFLGLGTTLHELKQADWDSWWMAQKIGWVMVQVGGIASSALLTFKAFVSNSSKSE